MKFPLIIILSILSLTAFAQKTITISTVTIDKDSIAIPFTEKYDLAEDAACAAIIRHVRYNTYTGLYYGAFTDVSKDNPSLILARGTYTANGVRVGKLILYYPNGKINAEGYVQQLQYQGDWTFYYNNGNPKIKASFVNDVYTGRCVFFSEDGHRSLIFDANGNNCTIVDAWDKDEKQTVNNGTGYYTGDETTSAPWQGKLINGKPDSIWTCKQKVGKGVALLTEYFNAGTFVKGHVDYGNFQNDYTDASRINLMPLKPILMIARSDRPKFSGTTCNGKTYEECFYIFMGKKEHLYNLKTQASSY
jgi:hypothetical protein